MATTISLVISLISLILIVYLIFFKKTNTRGEDISHIIEKENEKMRKQINDTNTQLNNILLKSLELNNNRDNETLSKIDLQIEKLTKTVESKLSQISENNSKQLAEMKNTVDEHLNKNLTSRLNESFNLISERLESLYRGLGEIKNLSSNVGDLKRILGGVKTRGIMGEVQLSALLEQMLSPSQYLTNTTIKPNGTERVEFAIKLPGKDDKNILLPIDAKFPIEDYARLCDFLDRNMKTEAEQASKQIETRIKNEAKKINDKYICPPLTTDFAVMYIPTEGLFAEISRNVALVEEISQKYKIMICSPTTIAALLNSLQMGFKTLYIEKRSSEIWQLLGAFQREFLNFSDLINKTQKKISEASDTLESATKKSNKIKKQLTKVADNVPEYLTFDDNEQDDE